MSTNLDTDLPACAARYHSENGINAQVTDNGFLVVRAGDVGCIRMPALLGQDVASELERRGRATPIIVNEASRSWTVLTQRPEREYGLLHDPLFVHWAKRSVLGTQITLPGPNDPARRWHTTPDGLRRLPFELVADITLEQGEAMGKSAVGVA